MSDLQGCFLNVTEIAAVTEACKADLLTHLCSFKGPKALSRSLEGTVFV